MDGEALSSDGKPDPSDPLASTKSNEDGEQREARALLGWVQAVDNGTEEGILTRHVSSVDDLCDGVAFFDVLGSVDSTFFRNPHTADTKDNWILRTGTLKRLYKLVLQYYTEVLEQSSRALSIPDLEALAKEASLKELNKLGRLVIGIAVRSERANEHIAAIQSLPLEDQQQLMFAIEETVSSLQPLKIDNPESEEVLDTAISKDSASSPEMEKMYYDLLESHKQLQGSYSDLQAEAEEAKKGHVQYKEEVDKGRDVQADVLMRQEIDRLKNQLRKSEDDLGSSEVEVERLGVLLNDLTKKSNELQRKADDASKLKDQMEEYKHASERLQKTENVIEKYKKKLEESADVRRQLKLVEGEYAELVDRNAKVEEEHQKLVNFKPLMESYKSQIVTLEEKSSKLQREFDTSKYELEQAVIKLQAAEEARIREQEETSLYQERIRELELAGGGNKPLAASDVLGSDEDDNDAPQETLEDALSETTTTGLKLQVRKLLRELKAAKASKADASRLLVVENLLEDANRLRARYEKDYLKEYQKGLILESKIEEILEAKAGIGDGPEANYALRLRLNETVESLDAVNLELSKLKVDLEQSNRALTIAKSDLNLVGKDKLEMLDGVKASVNAENSDLEKSMQELNKEMQKKDEQLQMTLSQIKSLLIDKVDLKSDSTDQSENSLQREKELQMLQASMASPTGLSSEEANEAMLSKEAERKVVYEKLQKARAFIRQQDRLLQEAKAKGSAAPQEVLAKLKRAEQENVILRQEQRLMSSSWYDLQIRLQRELAMSGTFRKNGSNRAQTKAAVIVMGNKPKSWLQQQRQELAGGISLSRR